MACLGKEYMSGDIGTIDEHRVKRAVEKKMEVDLWVSLSHPTKHFMAEHTDALKFILEQKAGVYGNTFLHAFVDNI